MNRPAVSVVVPFLGDDGEARALLGMLGRLDPRPGDELIVADNTPAGVVATLADAGVVVVEAGDRRSASHARNAGAAAATAPWLLFTDADCEPPPGLIDAYFAEPPDERTAILAGEVEGDATQTAFLARWARSRRGRWVGHHQSSGPYPAGVTANLAVRRAAFEDLGGFRIGGGGDLDLCWRAQRAGLGFRYRPDVVVTHRDRERPLALGAQAIAYGGHQRRLRDLHGAEVPAARTAVPIARALGGALARAPVGRFEEAGFSLVDGYWALLQGLGWLTAGRGARRSD